jgi:hypothetical protein
MPGADRKVFEHAARNHGVVTRREAIALGMSPSTIRRRVLDGALVVVGHGILATPGVLTNELTVLLAATHALDAVASHESAARLHGLEGLKDLRPVVSVPIRRSNRFAGVVVHQLTDLVPEHTGTKYGVPVTTAPRTIIDLAAVAPGKLVQRLVDDANRIGIATYREVWDLLGQLARRGKPGIRKLRRILELRLDMNLVTDSTLEMRLIDLLTSAGIPLPQTQWTPPWLRHMNGRVDLVYRDAELIVEGDSFRWHNDPRSFQADRKRDNLAQLAGWTVLRFTWEDITKRPSYVVTSVRTALENSERRNVHI